MSAARFEKLDPLLTHEQADDLMRLCERYERYGTYAEESIEDDFGEGIAQRYDAAFNFVTTGGRFGRAEPLARLAARTNYFRVEYFYGESKIDGIDTFLHHDAFYEAARKIHDRPLVEPSIVYANLLVPGQELAVHTDVPEFRGISRRKDPQWLIVAMHHSGLFDRWRIHIATGVSWFGSPEGGEFVFYPNGWRGAPETIPVRHNTAIVLDTDSVFHGVDRVSEASGTLPQVGRSPELVYDGDGAWHLESEGSVAARYSWKDLRFSVSWKAYCYRDAEEQRSVREHSDDLERAQVIETLTQDLRQRGRIGNDTLDESDLAYAIIEEYIRFPEPTPEAAQG